jgi:hypothetical protein
VRRNVFAGPAALKVDFRQLRQYGRLSHPTRDVAVDLGELPPFIGRMEVKAHQTHVPSAAVAAHRAELLFYPAGKPQLFEQLRHSQQRFLHLGQFIRQALRKSAELLCGFRRNQKDVPGYSTGVPDLRIPLIRLENDIIAIIGIVLLGDLREFQGMSPHSVSPCR